MPGSGKSNTLAQITIELLKRNAKYKKRSGIERKVYSNVVLNDRISTLFSDIIVYYSNLLDLTPIRDADVVCQEISQYIDSQEFALLPRSFKAWLRKHRHYGIDIYGDTQDFLTVDVSFRRLVNNVYYCQKLIGSSDPSATRPKVNFIWGIIFRREIDPTSFDKEKEKYNFKPMSWSFGLISKSSCSVYDTRQDVPAPEYADLTHIERICRKPGCPKFGKIHLTHK